MKLAPENFAPEGPASGSRTRLSRRSSAALASLLVISGYMAAACGGGTGPDGSSGAAPNGGGLGSGASPSGVGSSPSTGASGSGVGGGGGGIEVPPVVPGEDGNPVDCSTLKRPPTPLRRLTRFEYNNSVRDLLNTSLLPAADFPPDEVADGYSNNALVLTISGLHLEKYTYAAEALAAEAATHLSTLLPCDPAAIGEEPCAQAFAESFGRRAFRRPLEDADRAALLEAYSYGDSFENGIEIMIRAILQSPHFLFRVEFTGAKSPGAGMVRLNPFETATRLSFLIWSSGPDDALLDAAANGQLATADDVAREARRLLADPKARAAVAEFYRQWLSLTRLDTVSKDTTAFPLWSDAMRAAMVKEANAVVESVVFSSDASLKRLLTEPLGLPSGPLATLYGVPESETVTTLSATERAGVLTLPGVMAVKAHPDQTSPTLRGKLVREKLLCEHVDPPPDNVDISIPSVTAGPTARDRFSPHVAGPCQECHALMDPLGYPFESYDSVGEFRTTESGVTLDLSGEFVNTDAMDGPFNGALEMATKLGDAPEVAACVAKQWYQFANGRSPEAGDACSLAPLQKAFTDKGANLYELLVDTTQTEAFLYRQAEPAP